MKLLVGLKMEEDCTACSPGSYCEKSNLTAPMGDCAAGYYCTKGAVTRKVSVYDGTGGNCTRGHYCLEGSANPKPCEVIVTL